MKTLNCVFALLFLCACDLIQLQEQFPGLPSQGQRRDSESALGKNPWEGYPFSSSDSCLLFTAVRNDSCAKKLTLYRNWEEVLTMEAGEGTCVSADADMHHIIEGTLYTEYHTDSETLIGREGKEIARFRGKEFLAGLMENGDDIYILSVPVSGRGFTLRKNGTVMLARDDGSLFGGFQEPSYFPWGALCKDGSHHCFSCRYSNGDYAVFVDGREMAVDINDKLSPYQDIRMFGGVTDVASWHLNYVNWENSRLWYDGEYFVQTGDITESRLGSISGMSRIGRLPLELLSVRGATLYYQPNQPLYGVLQDSRGGVYALNSSLHYSKARLEGRYKFFLPSCGKLTGDGMILGLNRQEGGSLVWFKGRYWDLGWVDGDLCSLEFYVSPSS